MDEQAADDAVVENFMTDQVAADPREETVDVGCMNLHTGVVFERINTPT